MKKNTITLQEALDLLNKYVQSPQMREHCLGAGLIMEALALRLGENPQYWKSVTIIHDLDMDIINGDLTRHGYATVDILTEEGYDLPEAFAAILAHTETLDFSTERRRSKLDYILAGAENLQGLLHAYALMRGSLVGAEPKSVVKKLKDKSFAASVNRSFVADAIEKSGLERTEFIQIAVDALTKEATETMTSNGV